MNNIVQSSNGSSIVISNNKVIINGKEVNSPPCSTNCSSIINGVVFIGKYEFKNDKWVKTFRSIWNYYFGQGIDFTTYDGMCGYNFNKFFQEKDIDNEMDLRIQEMALETINKLIDLGILGLQKHDFICYLYTT